MMDFEDYIDRHGEGAVQELIERIERYEGVQNPISTPLEMRWKTLMQSVPFERSEA